MGVIRVAGTIQSHSVGLRLEATHVEGGAHFEGDSSLAGGESWELYSFASWVA